jgi:hypothetical protein
MFKIGDKVSFNDKYPDTQQYAGREYTIRDVGIIGKTRVAWLQGLTGCFAVDGLNLEEELISMREHRVAKIEGGKITEMDIPVAKIQNSKVVEMNI